MVDAWRGRGTAAGWTRRLVQGRGEHGHRGINTAVEAGAQPRNILVRGDSAYCDGKIIAAVVKAGAMFSFAIAGDCAVDAAIAGIPDDAFVPVHYPGAVTDPIPAN